MEQRKTITKNEEYEIYIQGMGHDGEGVGKIEDFTIFVPGALLHEEVKIKVVKVNKKYGFGRLVEVLKASSEREEPVCSIYKRCGGCQLQHLSYKGQLEFKKQRVTDAIERIGKLSNFKDIIIHPTLPMETPYRYRNKVQLPVGRINGEVAIGFYAQRSHEIIDMKVCHIQDEVGDQVVEITRAWVKKFGISIYEEEKNQGLLRHVMIRRGFKTGEVMVVLVTTTEEIPHSMEFIEMLKEKITNLASVVQNINKEKTNVILGRKLIPLWGKESITDYIGEFKFNINPLSFFQVNPIQTEKLYEKALQYANLTGNEVVFDAYCGTGTISLFLSQKAKKVYGVELVPQAIEDAKANAVENGIVNAEFIVGESETEIPKLIEKGIKADVVVVDPPRKGCAPELLEAIAKMNPKTIVYVSCDPGTLARDLAILEGYNYLTEEVQPVDMFPQTAHVECVVRIERK